MIIFINKIEENLTVAMDSHKYLSAKSAGFIFSLGSYEIKPLPRFPFFVYFSVYGLVFRVG